MQEKVHFYRVISCGRERGPWRVDREQARRDAIDQGLGSYDEWGKYFDVVPGRIEQVELPTRLLLSTIEAVSPQTTRVNRSRSPARVSCTPARPRARSLGASG